MPYVLLARNVRSPIGTVNVMIPCTWSRSAWVHDHFQLHVSFISKHGSFKLTCDQVWQTYALFACCHSIHLTDIMIPLMQIVWANSVFRQWYCSTKAEDYPDTIQTLLGETILNPLKAQDYVSPETPWNCHI